MADSIPMALNCPACGAQHIDEGEWATKPHRTHLCANCGNEFRPANVSTVGVWPLAILSAMLDKQRGRNG